jgi:hypothetical protein
VLVSHVVKASHGGDPKARGHSCGGCSRIHTPTALLRTTPLRWPGALLVALVAIGIVAWQVAERLGAPSRERCGRFSMPRGTGHRVPLYAGRRLICGLIADGSGPARHRDGALLPAPTLLRGRSKKRAAARRLPICPAVHRSAAKKKFKFYAIGYFHIDIAEMRTEEGKLYLFVAIDRTTFDMLCDANSIGGSVVRVIVRLPVDPPPACVGTSLE